MTALIGAGGGFPVSSSFVPVAFWNQVVAVYVVFYSNVTHPWSAGQKTLVLGWLNNISSTPWWGFVRDYPNNSILNGFTAAGLTFVSSFEDLEAEGTTFDCNTPASDDAAAAINAAISGGHLPNDPHGLYVVLPSWTDITTTGGCAGAHNVTPTTSLPYFFATRPTAAPYGTTSPNADYLFDNEMEVSSHELAESLTTGTHIGGSGCGLNNEIGDVCEGCQSTSSNGGVVGGMEYVGVNAFVGTNGAPASIRIPAVGDFWIAAPYSPEQGGHCVSAQTPAALSDNAQCVVNADCSWSKHCIALHCAIPTCSDGIKNGAESDTDCGSWCGMDAHSVPEPGNCATGKHCVTNWDCVSLNCNSGTCL